MDRHLQVFGELAGFVKSANIRPNPFRKVMIRSDNLTIPVNETCLELRNANQFIVTLINSI